MPLSTQFAKLLVVRHPIALAPMAGRPVARSPRVSHAPADSACSAPGTEIRNGWNASCRLSLRVPTSRGVSVSSPGRWTPPRCTAQSTTVPARSCCTFGDPNPFVEPIRRAGAVLIIQITDLDEARHAIDLGADVIVAQGTEAGGHEARRGRSTLPFLPVVVDLAAPLPVLGAGGIADGRGLAAALVLGAAGALVGTRFRATTDALVDPAITKAIIEGRGEDTERSSILDIVRSSRWPTKCTARVTGRRDRSCSACGLM
jgi:nitronate monooxygenase